MSSSRRAPLLAYLCALAVVSACKKPATAVPTQYDYAVFVPYSGAEVEGVELDGKPITKVDELARGTRFTAVVATADHAAQKPLQVVLKTSCGSTKVPGTLVFGLVKSSGAASEDQERAVVKPGDKVLSEVRYDAAPVVDVFVDVDGAEAAKVAVGALPLDKGKPPFRVALGACPTARDVRVDGASVGTLGAKALPFDADKPPVRAFVDAKGGHCYESKLHVYVKEGTGENIAQSKVEPLAGARVYDVEVDDFLVPSPDKVTSKDDFPMRREIRRCAAAPATKPRRK
jgi:hypothetical protein